MQCSSLTQYLACSKYVVNVGSMAGWRRKEGRRERRCMNGYNSTFSRSYVPREGVHS